MGFRKK